MQRRGLERLRSGHGGEIREPEVGATPWLGVRWSGRSAVEVVGRRQEPCTGRKRKVFKRTVIRASLDSESVDRPDHRGAGRVVARANCRFPAEIRWRPERANPMVVIQRDGHHPARPKGQASHLALAKCENGRGNAVSGQRLEVARFCVTLACNFVADSASGGQTVTTCRSLVAGRWRRPSQSAGGGTMPCDGSLRPLCAHEDQRKRLLIKRNSR